MKKQIALSLIAALLLSLSACGKAPTEINCEGPTAPESTPEQTTALQPPTTTAPEETETVIFPPTPTVPAVYSETGFYNAPHMDYENLRSRYHGFTVLESPTLGEESTLSALRFLTYDELQAFLKEVPYPCEATEALETYDEAFFAENAILAIPFTESSSTRHSLERLTIDYSSYLIELRQNRPTISTADLTVNMLIIPDEKYCIERARVNILTTVYIQNENGDFVSTAEDIVPSGTDAAIAKTLYSHESLLTNGYAHEEMPSEFSSGKVKLLRFHDWESYDAWQTNTLFPFEAQNTSKYAETAKEESLRYDEAFFEENSLFVFYFARGSGSYSHAFSSATYDRNDRITVSICTTKPGFQDNMGAWLIFLPVKSEYADAQTVKIINIPSY